MNVAIALGWPIIFAQSPQPTEVGLGWPTWIKWLLWLALGFFGLFPGIVAYMVWAERKVAARFQDRIGPNRVGPLGLLQPIADALKLLTKESIVPRAADQWVHLLAPVVILTSAFLVLAVIPFGVNLAPVNIPSGLLYLVAVSGLSPLGIFLAGWSSRNKYALLGAMRAVAQLVSYEIPQVLSTVPIVLWSGSLSLVTIFNKQLDYGWFLFSPPGALAFVILLIASLAEVNRTPFDLPEAESEIIAGFHTEFSSMRFGLFFLAEYLSVFGVSCLATALFLGGGTPIPFSDFPINLLGTTTTSYVLVNAILVPTFFLKVGLMVFVMFWVRATLPRMRVDRLMNFAWKYMVPMSLVNILAAAVWYECYIRSSRPFVLFGTPLRLGPLPLNWLISTLITLLILFPSFLGVQAINRREFGEEVGTTAPARCAAPVPVAAR
ncbi:MAG: NADH-quinone oxidoreductase subunit NuoH [Planctomycetaceae bacterium]|nr:NADH-quinone oxidoreductase subunit NuoH [Planctomycetaceae bacterium]